MTDKEKQQEELRLLQGKGILVNIAGRKVHIKEPTLATLDAMSEEWLQLDDVPDNITMQEAMELGKTAVHRHARRMARVTAIAILGEQHNGIIGRFRTWRLSKALYHSCKPSDLKQIAETIIATSGLVNFTISMKLMSTAVTTTAKTDIE